MEERNKAGLNTEAHAVHWPGVRMIHTVEEIEEEIGTVKKKHLCTEQKKDKRSMLKAPAPPESWSPGRMDNVLTLVWQL